MKGYIWTRRGIMMIMALLISITFLCHLAKYRANSLYADICEEELIDIIEPQNNLDIKIC